MVVGGYVAGTYGGISFGARVEGAMCEDKSTGKADVNTRDE